MTVKKMNKGLLPSIAAILFSLGVPSLKANPPVMVKCEGVRTDSSMGCKKGCSVHKLVPSFKIMPLEECLRQGGAPVNLEQSNNASPNNPASSAEKK